MFTIRFYTKDGKAVYMQCDSSGFVETLQGEPAFTVCVEITGGEFLRLNRFKKKPPITGRRGVMGRRTKAKATGQIGC